MQYPLKLTTVTLAISWLLSTQSYTSTFLSCMCIHIQDYISFFFVHAVISESHHHSAAELSCKLTITIFFQEQPSEASKAIINWQQCQLKTRQHIGLVSFIPPFTFLRCKCIVIRFRAPSSAVLQLSLVSHRHSNANMRMPLQLQRTTWSIIPQE